MTTNKTNFILVAVVLFVLAAVAMAASEWISHAQGQNVVRAQIQGPHLSISPLEHDFGTLRQSGGVASTTFDVLNDGSGEADVTDVLASCSCTTGKIDKKILQPGEHASLSVFFDPDYHYEGEGQFFRTVTVRSNAPGPAPEAKIYVTVNYDLGKDKLKFPPDAD